VVNRADKADVNSRIWNESWLKSSSTASLASGEGHETIIRTADFFLKNSNNYQQETFFNDDFINRVFQILHVRWRVLTALFSTFLK
jgi:hypothetical protein